MAALDRDMLKRCCTCKQEKPLMAFHLDKSKKDGRRFQCKGCAAAYEKARRAANRNQINEQQRARKTANKDRINEQRRTNYAANRDRINEQKRTRRASKRERVNEQQRAYRTANKDKVKEWAKANYAANRDQTLRRKKAEVKNMSSAYVKRLLTRNSPLRHADIPDWLVEAKRAQLLLKREANK